MADKEKRKATYRQLNIRANVVKAIGAFDYNAKPPQLLERHCQKTWTPGRSVVFIHFVTIQIKERK